MKTFATGFLILVTLAIAIDAQPTTRLRQCPAKFRAFYSQFAAAARRSDKNAIASVTKFPFKWAFDAGDSGTYTRSQFMRNFNQLFDRDTKEFLRQKNPYCSVMEKGTIDLMSDDAMHFNFVRSGSTYKFSVYFIEP